MAACSAFIASIFFVKDWRFGAGAGQLPADEDAGDVCDVFNFSVGVPTITWPAGDWISQLLISPDMAPQRRLRLRWMMHSRGCRAGNLRRRMRHGVADMGCVPVAARDIPRMASPSGTAKEMGSVRVTEEQTWNCCSVGVSPLVFGLHDEVKRLRNRRLIVLCWSPRPHKWKAFCHAPSEMIV